MAEQSQPQSETTITTIAIVSAVSEKLSNVSFNIRLPSDRTRDTLRKCLIETFSSPSIVSKQYATVSHEEAVEAAKIIEEEAFEVAGKAVTGEDDEIEVLQVYSKEISKRMIDKMKAKSEVSEAPAATPLTGEPSKAEEKDAGSTAPPQSQKTESVADDE